MCPLVEDDIDNQLRTRTSVRYRILLNQEWCKMYIPSLAVYQSLLTLRLVTLLVFN